tara:strand:+ start:324 stop:1046 length:723 start_codon:yes stop_codon:yes gene_type:complete
MGKKFRIFRYTLFFVLIICNLYSVESKEVLEARKSLELQKIMLRFDYNKDGELSEGERLMAKKVLQREKQTALRKKKKKIENRFNTEKIDQRIHNPSPPPIPTVKSSPVTLFNKAKIETEVKESINLLKEVNRVMSNSSTLSPKPKKTLSLQEKIKNNKQSFLKTYDIDKSGNLSEREKILARSKIKSKANDAFSSRVNKASLSNKMKTFEMKLYEKFKKYDLNNDGKISTVEQKAISNN